MYFKTYVPFWEHREEYIQHLSCSLIVASRFHPTPLLLSLLDFVAPSRPFVVYCQYKEVILKQNGGEFLYLNIGSQIVWP